VRRLTLRCRRRTSLLTSAATSWITPAQASVFICIHLWFHPNKICHE
jgi:hypothetical protein